MDVAIKFCALLFFRVSENVGFKIDATTKIFRGISFLVRPDIFRGKTCKFSSVGGISYAAFLFGRIFYVCSCFPTWATFLQDAKTENHASGISISDFSSWQVFWTSSATLYRRVFAKHSREAGKFIAPSGFLECHGRRERKKRTLAPESSKQCHNLLIMLSNQFPFCMHTKASSALQPVQSDGKSWWLKIWDGTSKIQSKDVLIKFFLSPNSFVLSGFSPFLHSRLNLRFQREEFRTSERHSLGDDPYRNNFGGLFFSFLPTKASCIKPSSSRM